MTFHLPACALVVSFNPEPDVLFRLLDSLELNSCDFLLIDNGSSNLEQIRARAQAYRHCKLMQCLPENIGLASAINQGLHQLIELGFDLAYLFDQDSDIGPDFCENMQLAWHKAQAKLGDRLAAIGPRVQDPVTGRLVPFRSFDRLLPRPEQASAFDPHFFEAGFLITSGTLLNLNALGRIGYMKDSYFIDNVDLEWCFRAKFLGYVIYGTDHARLLHRIGVYSRNVLVHSGIIVKHSPARLYYTSRNRVHLYRQPHAPLKWKLRDLPRFVIKTSLLLLFSSQRRDYWRNLVRGIKDSKALA